MTILLGTCFSTRQTHDRDERITTFPRFTYRHSMVPLPHSGSRSDQHWGCCIRCAQGLLAQFIIRYSEKDSQNYATSFPGFPHHFALFYDLARKDAPFGIHAFCEVVFEITHKTGKWVKTSCIATVLQRLLDQYGISALIPENGFFLKLTLTNALALGKPVLMLIPLMLGPTALDSDYEAFVKMAVSLPDQAIGIIGGKQGKAFFVVGYHDDDLLFFDPHMVMEPVRKSEDETRLFEPQLKNMKARALNSSMLVGFFVQNLHDVEEIAELAKPFTRCPFALTDEELPRTVVVDEDGDWTVVNADFA
jgi:cysteine protease ATG4